MELNLTKPIVFLDLETTGIKVATDRIIEICFLRQQVKAIHGITDEDVKDSPVFKQVAHE